MSPPAAERLGEIRSPSGSVVVLDAGYLNLWCHDRAPLLPPGVLSSPEETEQANAAIDYRITGPDAEAAGKAFDRQWHPLFVYDIPERGAAELERSFASLTAERGWNAKLERLQARVPHLERARETLRFGRGAGEFTLSGLMTVAIGDLPTDATLPVLGTRMPSGEHEHRWRRIWIPCREGTVASEERCGHAYVDFARLIVADVEALGVWEHEEPIDGLADYVFWGRDAESVATIVGASSLDGGAFGWLDLQVEEAVARGRDVEARRSESCLFASDFRPHSHHFQLMQQVRASATESGVLDFGEARLCGFMTSWGDGVFEVWRDLDENGRLLNLRLELGTEKRVELLAEVWRRAQVRARGAIVSRRVWEDGVPPGFLQRFDPTNADDSGWCLNTGTESQEYLDDAANSWVVPLDEICQRYPDLEQVLLEAPVGSAFTRSAEGELTRYEE